MEGVPDTALTSPVSSLAAALSAAGHDAVLVGGAVRDALLGRPVSDLDIATDATPDQVRAIAGPAEWLKSIYAVGERFGTLGLVLIDGTLVEVSRYRDPALTGATLAERFAADAALRDFTVNALGVDLASETLLDPMGGRADIEARMLRAPGDPADRFAEDPLRVLRAARLTAELGFSIEPATFSAMKAAAPDVGRIAVERVRDEVTKLLVAPDVTRGLEALRDSGALAVVLPEVAALDGVTQPTFHDLDVLAHTIQAVGNAPANPVLRWATLLHDVGKGPTRTIEPDGRIRFFRHAKVGAEIAEKICARLRMSNADTAAIVHLVREHMRLGDLHTDNRRAVDRAVRRLDMWGRGASASTPIVSAEDALELMMADYEATAQRENGPQVREGLASVIAASRARGTHLRVESPVSGGEIMQELGIGEGSGVGAAKSAIEAAVASGALDAQDREGALEIAKRAATARRGGSE